MAIGGLITATLLTLGCRYFILVFFQSESKDGMEVPEVLEVMEVLGGCWR